MGPNKIYFPQGCWIRKWGYDLTLQNFEMSPTGKGNHNVGESENVELKVKCHMTELKSKNSLTQSTEIWPDLPSKESTSQALNEFE